MREPELTMSGITSPPHRRASTGPFSLISSGPLKQKDQTSFMGVCLDTHGEFIKLFLGIYACGKIASNWHPVQTTLNSLANCALNNETIFMWNVL
jgi:hypothetical protein